MHNSGIFVIGQLTPPFQRTTGLGCICEGDVVSYSCSLRGDTAVTVLGWERD